VEEGQALLQRRAVRQIRRISSLTPPEGHQQRNLTLPRQHSEVESRAHGLQRRNHLCAPFRSICRRSAVEPDSRTAVTVAVVLCSISYDRLRLADGGPRTLSAFYDPASRANTNRQQSRGPRGPSRAVIVGAGSAAARRSPSMGLDGRERSRPRATGRRASDGLAVMGATRLRGAAFSWRRAAACRRRPAAAERCGRRAAARAAVRGNTRGEWLAPFSFQKGFVVAGAVDNVKHFDLTR
jgi:hypothetical protein